jgi:CheY-like chemotaxis protein
VDDRKTARTTIKSMLAGLKYEITEVSSGEDALETLAKEDYDTIILDIRLGGINGFQMLEDAKALREDLPPIVVLTDYEEYAFKAGKLPEVFRFIRKIELEPEGFKEVIVSAVKQKQELSKVKVKRCFKHNQFGCNISLKVQRNLVFVGIPFNMKKVYEKGIRPLVNSFGFNCWRANEVHRTGDFGCKICGMIQACRFAIFDISSLSPNIMLELGFAFALGKEVIILKNKKMNNIKLPSNLGDTYEHVRYGSVAELSEKLEPYVRAYVNERQS